MDDDQLINEEEIPHEDEIFADDTERAVQRKEEIEREESINQLVESLCRQLALEESEDLPELSGLSLNPSAINADEVKCFSTSNINPRLSVLVCYYDTLETIYYDDATLLGVIEFSTLYPATSLRKEEVSDKLADIFSKADIDFKEQKLFSKTFHLVSSDREFIMQKWEGKPLDMLADFPSLELVIEERQCVFRCFINNIDQDKVDAFVKLSTLLLKIVN